MELSSSCIPCLSLHQESATTLSSHQASATTLSSHLVSPTTLYPRTRHQLPLFASLADYSSDSNDRLAFKKEDFILVSNTDEQERLFGLHRATKYFPKPYVRKTLERMMRYECRIHAVYFHWQCCEKIFCLRPRLLWVRHLRCRLLMTAVPTIHRKEWWLHPATLGLEAVTSALLMKRLRVAWRLLGEGVAMRG